jgi:hypothetical protein
MEALTNRTNVRHLEIRPTHEPLDQVPTADRVVGGSRQLIQVVTILESGR